MARLQDFSDVTPSSSSDKLLIVQSAGQGLATLDTAGQQIANNTSVSQLNTTRKTLVGAINEHDSEIGSLSTLTTTDKSSIVGAVNEVNKITDITSDYITMASGYTFVSGKVYKQGKHIFGNIVLSGTLRGGNDVDTLGTIKSSYRTSDAVNGFCGISNGPWFTNNIGYVYIGVNGALQTATTPTGMNYAKIHLDYVTA